MTHPSHSLIAAQHRTGQAIVEYLPLRPWQLRDLSAPTAFLTPANPSEETRRGILAEIAAGECHAD